MRPRAPLRDFSAALAWDFGPAVSRVQTELSQTDSTDLSDLSDPSDLSDLSDPFAPIEQSAGSRVLKWFKFAAGVRTTCDCAVEISSTKSKASLLLNLSSSCWMAIFGLMDV